jgi:hypothetical protein
MTTEIASWQTPSFSGSQGGNCERYLRLIRTAGLSLPPVDP